MRNTRALGFVLAVVVVAGCAAQRPVLYRNEQYRAAGEDRADADVDACEDRASAELSDRGSGGQAVGDAARETAIGAGAGAAGGAVWGAIRGGVGSGAAGGAAGGAAAGLVGWALRGMFDRKPPDPGYRALVERCLTQQGYEPIAWH